MKRKTFILAALLFGATYATQAQYTYKPFRIDVGAGLSFPATTFGVGILGSVEPQFSVGPFAVGARIEYHVEGYETEEKGIISSITKFNSAMLLTGDYRFSSGTARPFVGVGLGSYVTAAGFWKEDYDRVYRLFGPQVGVMLRTGFDLPHFRFALHGHITGSRKLEGMNVNFSYIALTIAVGISGGRVE
jgi:hypothetical protein